MKTYTITILEDTFQELMSFLSSSKKEEAAYLLCSQSESDDEYRFLVQKVIPVSVDEYLRQKTDCLSIDSNSYARIAKRAKSSNSSILFIHSHPNDYPNFSLKDDVEDPKLIEFFNNRIPGVTHGSLILSNKKFLGRIYVKDKKVPIKRIRVIGTRFTFYNLEQDSEPIPIFFDRQVRAFGPDLQKTLKQLHVGVAGTGGTGSSVIEQLTRLGVGTLSIFDGDDFDPTNVNRMYGSRSTHKGEKKVKILSDHVESICLGTALKTYPSHISEEKVAKQLKECDVIFGCTDKEYPRSILNNIAIQYFIPVIDLGVKIDSNQDVIQSINGRITTLYPGTACLFCRERITSETIRAEVLPLDEHTKQVKEGYVPALKLNNPAVITFTTMVASQAVNELIHRLTGFLGIERKSTEVLFLFHNTEIKRNSQQPNQDCGVCMKKKLWGIGDNNRNFLGRVW